MPDAEVRPLPPAVAAQLARVLRAETADELADAFAAMGVVDPVADSMEGLHKAVGTYALVVLGPAATSFWRRPCLALSGVHCQPRVLGYAPGRQNSMDSLRKI